MSKTQWLVLLCLFIIYLLLGASLFYFIESEEEKQNNIRDKKEKEVIEGNCSRFKAKLHIPYSYINMLYLLVWNPTI